MKVCLVTHGRVNPDGENGVTRTVYNLNKYLNKKGVEARIFSFNDGQQGVSEYIRDEHTNIMLFPRASFFSKNKFESYILSDDFDYDVVHFHIMWMIDKNTILKALDKKNIPYVITAHGSYAPNLLNTLKKKLSMMTLEGQYLRKASLIHALCNEEKTNLMEFGINTSIKVIPNGISENEAIKISAARNYPNPYDQHFFNIVWVGRIREDKNVCGIINSLRFIEPHVRESIRIHIIGNGDDSYIESLKSLCIEFGLDKYVVFHGPKYKEEKYSYVLNANAYLQPSYSEGVSFSILDAMACGVPIILSRQTNMTYYYDQKFFIMTEPHPEDIALSIIRVVSDRELRETLSLNSRRMIKSVFNWDNLIDEYLTMYRDVIGEPNE